MSFTAQRLYELLPAIYRIRDAERGEPLRALLAVLAEQAAVLEENLEQLYDDQFIETCAEWVVPYIGDLIGYRSLHGVAPRISSPRAEVGHTIGHRRRKGTAAMLEQLARDVTGWDARVVEAFQLLATSQYLNHLRPGHWYAPDLRRWEALERLETPFDRVAHTVDVRRIAAGRGLHNIPNIGVFLWRLRAYSLTRSPASRLDDRRYLFAPLGNSAPLFTRPETEDEVTHLAEPLNVPMPIGRRALHQDLDAYYGKGKSLFLEVDGAEVGAAQVRAGDLSDAGGGTWAHQPQDAIAIDPVLGRIAFPQNQPPPAMVRVTFHYGFGGDTGGGEYPREVSDDAGLAPVERVPAPHPTIQDALSAIAGGGAVEIVESGRFAETPSIAVAAGARLALRAAEQRRPLVALGGDLIIAGGADSEVTLDGLLIRGGALRVPATPENRLRRLRLRHCTLVPGLGLTAGGTPEQPGQPSLVVELAGVIVEIDHCIVGGVRAVPGATLSIADSIVDATGETAVAYAHPDGQAAGGALRVLSSTVIGKVHAEALELASNSIFLAALAPGDTWTAPVRSQRMQEGCARFSYLPLSSVVPRRYRCHPQGQADAARVRPQFTSLRYGDPGYGQLGRRCPPEIRTGADDEAEMGAFHALAQPQRETNLRVRLDEYLRVGLEAGIRYAT